MLNAVGDGDVESGGKRKRLRGYVLTLMWNAAGNFDVECGGGCDVKSGGERKHLHGYVLTLMWNVTENFDM